MIFEANTADHFVCLFDVSKILMEELWETQYFHWYFFSCRSLVVVPPDEEEKSLLVKLLGPLLATLVRIKGKWISPI